ncbi:MAG TPA: hypothetical protein VEN81_07175 [Planctomycetota bacterium]|nr:hypothetical protein [Planctomycetota bacterium]
MNPKPIALGVCPKAGGWILLGTVVLGISVLGVRSPSEETVRRSHRRMPPGSTMESTVRSEGIREQTPVTVEDSRLERRIQSLPISVSAPVPPPEIAGSVDLLEPWILGLPEPDLKALDASGALNRHLARIVAEVSRRYSDPRASARELDLFFRQLNARLGVTVQ